MVSQTHSVNSVFLGSRAVKYSSDNCIMSNLTEINEIQELIKRQAQAWSMANPDKIVADFAEDALFIAPSLQIKGKQQIKQAAQDYFASYHNVKIKIHRIIANGNQGAVEWSWSEVNRETGERSEAEDAIIFELESGKIQYWREYIELVKSA